MSLLTFFLWIGVSYAKPPVASWEPPPELVEDYNRAVATMNEGNPAKAEEIARKVVAKAPDCGMALLLLAQVRNRQNHPADAVEVVRHAAALFPEQSFTHAVLAEAAFGAQQFDLASEASARALALAPADVSIVSMAILTSLRLGDVKEARARLARVTLSEPSVACLEVGILLEEKDIAAARARFATCDASADPNLLGNAKSQMAAHTNDVDAMFERASEMGVSGAELVERGLNLFVANRCEEAVPVLDAAMVAVPKDVGVRVNRAQCLVKLGRLEEAEAALAEVLASDTWVDLHMSGAMTGITSKSQEELLRAVQRQAAVLLIEVQVKRSRTKEAATSLAKARERYGEVVEIVIAEADLRTAEGRAPEGWTLLRAAMTRFPEEPLLAKRLAHAAVDDPGALDAAIVAYVRANGTVIDRYNLGVAGGNGQDWALCTDELAWVATAEPTRRAAAEGAYSCAVSGGEVDRAFVLLGPLGNTPPGSGVHNHALALQKLDRHADALSLLKLYPATDPALEVGLRDLTIRSHLALGQLGEVVPLVLKPGLEPRFVTWVGQELLNAGRKNDAARVLGGTCAKLTGDDATWCTEMLAEAGRP
ncbi:MAG: tetratricopeptide repeat protein [Pseudomonadota bacterium]|nr:tetratricopeptide repeat protein [Pseudomonadota bacterium]